MESPKRTETMITGRKGSIGPPAPRPSTSLPQPHWKIATTTPNVAATAATFISAALSGMASERKPTRSSRQPRPITTPTKRGSLSTMTSAKSSYPAVTPPTCTSSEVPDSARGSTSSRSRSTRSLVCFDCGDDSGTTVRYAVSPPRAVGRGRHRRDALGGAQGGVEVVQGEPVLGAVDVGDEGERAVHTGTEAVGEQVVGLAGGGRPGVVALVGGAQVEGEGGQCEDRHDDDRDRAEQLGVALHERRPAGGEPGRHLRLGPVLRQPAPLAAAERARADERQQGGQQGDGGGDGQDDGERGRYGDAAEAVQPEDQHAQQAYADGGAREDDRPSGGGDGVGGGLGDGEAALQPAPVPGHDEQRVVDADAEPDQRAEHGGEVGDGHDVPEEPDPGVGGADADQGGGYGEQRGGERAEGEEQDDGGDQHADDLGGVSAGGLAELDGAAAQLDLESVGPSGLGRLHHGGGLARVDVLGLVVEGDRGVGGAAVRADPAGALVAVRTAHGGHAGQVTDAFQGAGHGLFDA